MKTKNFLIPLFFIAILSAKSCIKKDNTGNQLLYSEIEKVFLNSVEKDTTLYFSMDTLTDFDWEFLIILPPYTNLERLSNKTDVNLDELEVTGITELDSNCLIAFIKEKKLITYVKIPRHLGDFASINNYSLFNPENAVFKIENREVGSVSN